MKGEKEKCARKKVALFKEAKYVGATCLNCAIKMKDEDDSYDFLTIEELEERKLL